MKMRYSESGKERHGLCQGTVIGMRKVLLPLGVVLISALILFNWSSLSRQTGFSSVPEPGAEKPERARIYYGPSNSIAVLAFSHSGPVQQDSFFPAGFSGELHRLVTRTPGLQVTSANSSFFFADQSVALPIIAERLQVRHLLSGEASHDDGRVLVSARLFDAKNKTQVWSASFEGELGEIFAIQEDILQAIMETLKAARQSDLPRAIPVNPQAWMSRLQGIHYQAELTASGFEKAEQAFQAALDAEPGYAMAYVALAELWLRKKAAGDESENLVEKAREALAAALRSDPELPAALRLSSYLQRNMDWDWQAAAKSAEQGLRLSPGDPELMSTASLALFSLGQFERAGDLLAASVRQDPLNLARRLRLGLLQEFAGDLDQALSTYRQIIGLNPDFPGARAYRARIKLLQDKPDSALKESELEADPYWQRYSRILALSALGREQEAEPLLQEMIAKHGGDSAYQLTELMAYRNEPDQAFDWFQRAFEQRDGGMSEIIGNRFLVNLQDDPRWREMLHRMRLPLDSLE